MDYLGGLLLFLVIASGFLVVKGQEEKDARRARLEQKLDHIEMLIQELSAYHPR